jgi:hypothetical protein
MCGSAVDIVADRGSVSPTDGTRTAAGRHDETADDGVESGSRWLLTGGLHTKVRLRIPVTVAVDIPVRHSFIDFTIAVVIHPVSTNIGHCRVDIWVAVIAVRSAHAQTTRGFPIAVDVEETRSTA